MLALHAARKASVNIRKLPGTHRIIDVVRRLSYRMGSVTIADFDEDLIITLDLSEHMASQIFWFGYYSRDVAVLLKDYLPAGGIFLDGGANIGELTLLAAKRVGAAGRVISFEPVEEIRKKLIQHIDWNKFGSIVSVREQGLSDQIGTHLMYGATTSYGDGSQHSGLGTIFPTDTRGSELGMIALTTIDRTVKDLNLTRLDGIKLDIEGAELAAIREAPKQSSDSSPG
ncbi:FkbM family methyltransferase (plasmid) [Rhizobium sp. 32-5/1]|uniref:FkbM family methyltransferase n=1 Tax=Rhizobium sp. 32-5/1 TaxID=3019602 RepID=UPI00240D681B|nr:FkbM family methyltransferase [Rhizobium sp. 32-5/1]WEZ85875.1 FkbM family methyltransferase [Rhizobium sp. 32-5/1]